mmetsp:Transcript_23588/g.37613  ORF Transcript_23588/g.37613 Transcript_23588/m.37613 type:complete len:96 (+) Transcript_23588:52-339(+)
MDAMANPVPTIQARRMDAKILLSRYPFPMYVAITGPIPLPRLFKKPSKLVYMSIHLFGHIFSESPNTRPFASVRDVSTATRPMVQIAILEATGRL